MERNPVMIEAARDFERAAELLSGHGAPEDLLRELREEASYLRSGDLEPLGSLPGAQVRYVACSRISRGQAIVRWAGSPSVPLDAVYFAALDVTRRQEACPECGSQDRIYAGPTLAECAVCGRVWDLHWNDVPAVSEEERSALADALLMYAEGVEENLRDDAPEGVEDFPYVEDLQGQADRIRSGQWSGLDDDTFAILEELRGVYDLDHLEAGLDALQAWRAARA